MTSSCIRTLALAGLLLTFAAAASAEDDAVAQGRQLYLEYCGSCHGLTGEGRSGGACIDHSAGNLRRLSERLGNPLPEA